MPGGVDLLVKQSGGDRLNQTGLTFPTLRR